MNDLELLRQYEPVVRYTKGELFFPCAVDEFVRRCSLWLNPRRGEPTLLAAENELDVDTLARFDVVPADHVLYLQFVDHPLDALHYQEWQRAPEHRLFRAPGRLTRVPLTSRIADSVFDLSLVLRGTVPGGTAAAAAIKYQEMLRSDPRRVYYGRVVRTGGWIVLQYLFFFAMNPWRSFYNGANDHESDWEQVFVYLYEGQDGAPAPRWVAYASHDFKGDDLRRRWDDPLLTKVGSHPVIFAGAGSHASYFQQGEYIMSAEPRFLTPVKNAVLTARRIWVEQLGQGDPHEAVDKAVSLASIPFVDYARGDGRTIGPGQDDEWTPILISDAVPWVDRYRGLWGLDTQDPFGGERAPAGPKYNRDGSVRQSWFDPLGWAGVDKLLPPPELMGRLQGRIQELQATRAEIDQKIETQRTLVRTLALDVQSLQVADYFSKLEKEESERLAREETQLQALVAEHSRTNELIDATHAHLAQVERGDSGEPDAHIRHSHHPAPPTKPPRRAVEVWAAISGALALLAFVWILIFLPPYWLLWALGVALIFGAVEATSRGKLIDFMLNTVIVLAVIAAVLLFIENWRTAIVLVLFGVVIFMIRDNLRELRRGR